MAFFCAFAAADVAFFAIPTIQWELIKVGFRGGLPMVHGLAKTGDIRVVDTVHTGPGGNLTFICKDKFKMYSEINMR